MPVPSFSLLYFILFPYFHFFFTTYFLLFPLLIFTSFSLPIFFFSLLVFFFFPSCFHSRFLLRWTGCAGSCLLFHSFFSLFVFFSTAYFLLFHCLFPSFPSLFSPLFPPQADRVCRFLTIFFFSLMFPMKDGQDCFTTCFFIKVNLIFFC